MSIFKIFEFGSHNQKAHHEIPANVENHLILHRLFPNQTSVIWSLFITLLYNLYIILIILYLRTAAGMETGGVPPIIKSEKTL